MHVVELELRNFCQHEARTFEFLPGLTAITGRNGAGKSNIVAGIGYALLGEIETPGVKKLNVRYGAADTEPAYVRAVFRHNGEVAEVTRYIRGDSPSQLTVNGAVITGDKRITAYFLEQLDTTSEIIHDTVLVSQGNMFGFLAKSPAVRDALFQRLFHTDKAKQIHAALTAYANNIPADSAADEVRAAETAVANAQQQLTAWQVELAKYPDEATLAASLRQVESLLIAHADRKAMESELRSITARSSVLAAGIEACNASILHWSSRAVSPDVLTALRREHDELLTRLGTWDVARRQAVEKQRLLAEIATATREQQALANVSLPTIDAVVEVPQEKKYEWHKLDAYISQFSRTGVTSCPTCGTAVSELPMTMEEAKVRRQVLQQEMDAYALAVSAAAKATVAVNAHAAKVAAVADRLRFAESKLESVASVIDIAELPSEADVRQRVELLRKQIADAGVAAGELVKHTAECAAMREEYAQRETRYAELMAAIAALSITGDENEARATQSTLQQQASQRQTAAAAIAAAVARLESQLAALQSATTRAAAAAVRAEFAQRCRDMAAVVARDAAPRFVAQQALSALTAATNKNLELFDAPFRVRPVDGISFEAVFLTGTVQPVERLSGGLQIVLAVAFRLAINSSYSNIGMLVLDEPTVYLDSQHIAGLPNVLSRLRSLTAERGLQCLIVTHEERLCHIFDRVIRV